MSNPIPSRCLLIDGHGLLYRAFFALPVMTTADGRHTHALLGFVRILQQLMRQWHPSHLAVIFDAGLPEHRTQLLADYKAHRPAMPAALREQIDYVNEYLAAATIPSLRIQGQEADDVLASLAARIEQRENIEILIASSDKDLYQLVNRQTDLVSPAGKPIRMGTEAVIAKTGVHPTRIAEWLALTGDSSDNIPGAPGIGPKTAARLLDEHGSLENLWANLEKVTPQTTRSTLQTFRDQIDRNLVLTTLRRDLEVDPEPWQTFIRQSPDRQLMSDFAERYEIKSLATAPAKDQQTLLNLQ